MRLFSSGAVYTSSSSSTAILSCTCGSAAALRRIVVPFAATAAISAFSVPVTLGSSRKMSAPTRCFASIS